MEGNQDEEALLRAVTLQNARSIFLARQRAEEQLVRTRDEFEGMTRELAHSLAMMRATLESTTDGILVTDGAGVVTGSNDKFATMWGLSPELLISRDHRRLLHAISAHFDDPAGFIARTDEIYAASPPESYDRLELKNGSVFERFSRIQFVDERNVGRVWSFRDITERRRTEEALHKQTEWLRQSEAQFRQLADALPQIVWTAGPDGFIEYYNERWYEFTGFPRGATGDKGWRRLLHPEDAERCMDTYYECVHSGNLFQMEFRFKDRHTGGFRWFLGRAYPVRDGRGGIVRWFGTHTDIDDTKKSQETTRFLADASAALGELTDYAGTLRRVAALAVPVFADHCTVHIQEADGSLTRLAVTHADRQMAELANVLHHRYPPLPTDAHGIMKVLRTGESEWLATIPDEVLQEMARDEEHLRLLRRLGYRSCLCVPLRSPVRIIGVLSFMTAQSGRVYTITDLAAAEDLAHRAVIAIEKARLVAALQESDRRKDEFLAILAHELRNPLAPIRNVVQIYQDRVSALPELKWATEVIDRQVHQLTRLVDDLLDISRITRGKIELRKENVELATVVNSAVEASRALIDKWGHELTVTLPREPVRLEADPTRLEQVLLNLLNNAAKYMDQGGRITLTAETAGAEVVIRVRDTGVGIPAEMLPRVFDMFIQVEVARDRSQGGLGIGLTLVRGLVEMHGGSVAARSEGLGLGSEFEVRLPVFTAAGREAAAATGAEKPASSASCRILVVDDNRDAADSMGILLSALGNEVATAHDGLEAVECAAAFKPDVVLLDIGLPKLDGYEAARRIRHLPGGRDMVLVALTGWGQARDRDRSREAGFDHHMTKPVEFAALQELLARPHVPPGA